MSERAPYSRVYWSITDDPRFADVYGDDAALALWLRLLMSADAMWPGSAPLPRSARPKALGRLVEAGIVELVGMDHYRIHGLDNEREKRKAAATTRGPSGDRSVTVRVPNGDLAKPSLAEPSTSRAEAPREDVDPADAYWQLTGKYPTEKTLSWVDDLTAKYGGDATIRALVTAHTADRATATLLGRAQDILRAEARQLDRREAQDEQRRLAEKRAIPRVEEPWRAEFREAIQRQYDELDGAA